MVILETVSLALIVTLCILCSYSDIKQGVIFNKVLIAFSVPAIAIDGLYYCIYCRDLLPTFILNILVVGATSLYLFFSHSFAGGDCKMAIALSLLYPARFYLSYGQSNITLVFFLGLAIIAGYIYLLILAIRNIATRKVTITRKYLSDSIINFLKSYFVASVYITLLNSLLVMLASKGVILSVWFSRLLCLGVAYTVGRFSQLKSKIFWLTAVLATIVISINFNFVPISLNPENYVLVFVLLLCRITISTTIYESVPVALLQKGMILSTMSSLLMQKSITRGLPPVSSENLNDRLSDSQIDSIKIWAKATHMKELTVVKKIPFAIFIAMGIFSYFILWGILV